MTANQIMTEFVFDIDDKEQFLIMKKWCQEVMGRSHFNDRDPNWYVGKYANGLVRSELGSKRIVIRNPEWGPIAGLIWS